MARFLVTVWPYLAHVHPNVAVAHSLRHRGHDVAFYTGNSVRNLLEAEGFRHFGFEHVDEQQVHGWVQEIGTLAPGLRTSSRLSELWRRWLVDTIPGQLSDLDGVLTGWKPQAIICDPALWGPAIILHETRRIPVAIFSYLAACQIPGRDGPLLATSLPRPRTWPEVLVHRGMRMAIDVFVGGIRRAANEQRRRHGLPALREPVAAFMGRLPLYLQMGAPEFDYLRKDLPPAVHYVGLCSWDTDAKDAVPEILSKLPRDRSIVHVTHGTNHSGEPLLLKAVLQGLGDLPVQIVATIGREHTLAELGIDRVPPNAIVEQWIPHSHLLPRVDAVVTTGGAGTLLKTLGAGVPLVVVPAAWDHPENAWRVAAAGAGLRLSERECTPARLRDAVRRVLDDPAFRKNAQRLSGAFARLGGPDRAADLAEGLVG